eukprot:scaffold11812_cov137-Skeletonema_dohrnii-CCMP3373.AAC.3
MMTSFGRQEGAKRRIRLSTSLPDAKRHETVVVSPKQHDQNPKSLKLQRLPFFAFVLLILVYCCIMCMHRSCRLHFSQDYNNANARQQTRTLQQQQLSITPSSVNINHDQMLHVIQTRFMQHQSHLTELGFARLALFEAFCLPSIMGQTSNNFLWIIRVDPNLNEEILGRMKERFGSKENIILLGSNHNPEGMGRDNTDFDHFLGIERSNEHDSGIVFSGNVTLLREAFERSAASSSSVLLETRLDADDALHKMYVEFIQNQAHKYLMSNYVGEDTSDQIWRMWCIHSNVEWHPLNPYPVSTDEASTGDKSKEEGYLLMYSDKSICTTPGLTFGYGFGTTRSSILEGRRLKHSDIVSTIAHCDGDQKLKCVSRLKELSPGALRARTATSAGMVNIITGDDHLDQSSNGLKQKKGNKQLMQQLSQQDFLWEGVERLFSVTKASARDTRSLIVSRMKFIAADNLRGLCTPGHSCKENGKVLLSAILKQHEDE